MRKLVKRLIIFALILSLAYPIFIWSSRFLPQEFKKNLVYLRGGYGYTYSRLQEAENYGKVDILIIGTSHAYRGLDTRIFNEAGLKAFNLGTSAQTPMQSLLLLKRYLKKLDPELIIFEVNPSRFSVDGLEPSLDIISNLPCLGSEELKMIAEINHLKLYNTWIFRWMNDLLKHQTFNEPKSKNGDHYVMGGFVERKPVRIYNPEQRNKVKIDFKDSQVKAFTEIMEYLESNNYTLLLVQAPVSSSRYSSIVNKEQIDEFYQNRGNYINYNLEHSWNDNAYFYDFHHLNQKGAKLFTKKIIEDIKAYEFE